MKYPYEQVDNGFSLETRRKINDNFKDIESDIIEVNQRVTSVDTVTSNRMTEIEKGVVEVNNKSVHFDDVDAELAEHSDLLEQLKASSIDGEVIAARNGFPSLLDFLKTLDKGSTIATKIFNPSAGQTVIDLTDTGELQAAGKIIMFLIDGSPQFDSYTWTNPTTLTMKSPFAGTEKVVIRYFVGNAAIRTGHNRSHEKGGFDELDAYKLLNGDTIKNNIGVLTDLPYWLQESLSKAIKVLNDHIRQYGVNVKQPPYNAYGDGASHPLSTRYNTLAEAQAVFPSAASLNDEIDWCAIQEALKSSVKTVFLPAGIFIVNKMLVYRDNVKMGGAGGKGATAIKTLGTWDVTTSPAVIKMCGNEGVISDVNISCLSITDNAQKPDVILIDRDAVSNNVIPWENTIYNVVTNGGKNSVWIKQGLETHLTRCQFKTGTEAGVLAHQPDVYINDVSTDGCRHGLRTLGGSVTAHHFHAIYSKEEGFYIEGGDFCQFTDCHADTSGRTGIRIINTKRIMFTATWSFNSGSEATGTYSDWSLTGVTESMFTNCNEKGGTQEAQGFLSKASFYIDATSERNHFVNCQGTLTPWAAGSDNGADVIMNKNRFVACTGALARYNSKDNTSKHAFSLAGAASTTFNSYLFFKPNLVSNAMVIEIRITARETNSPQNLYFGRMYKAITNSTTATEMTMVDLLGSGSTAAKNFTITASLHADGDKISLTLTNNNTSQTINYGIEVEYMHPPKFTA